MRFSIDIELDAPAEVVWEDISDIASHVDWMADAASITFTSDRTEGVDTRFDCVTKVGPLRTVDAMTITEWEPPHRMGVRHEGAVTGEGVFVLTPTGQGTTVFTWEEQLTLPWYFGGAVGAVVARPLLRFVWRRNLRRLRTRIARLGADPATPTPGGLVGAGRDAEIRELGPGRVVKIARAQDNIAGLRHEREVMEHVCAAGFPCPTPLETPPGGSEDWLVMERVSGPSMLQALSMRPWMVTRYARMLADLHAELGGIEAPGGWPQAGLGTSVVHLDLHPGNVKMTDDGPVVIDWARAGRGDPALDAAHTYVMLRTGSAEGGTAVQTAVVTLRRRFAEAFLAAAGPAARARIREAAEHRLLDRDLLAAERAGVFALARGELD